MTEHIHMFHLPKTLNEDPKSVRGAALESPKLTLGVWKQGVSREIPKEAHQ